jgi:hypothetical protein
MPDIEVHTDYNVPLDQDIRTVSATSFSLGITPDMMVVYSMKLPCGCCAVEFEVDIAEAERMVRHQLQAMLQAVQLARTGPGNTAH